MKQLLLVGALATTLIACDKKPETITPTPEPTGEGTMGFTFTNYVGDKLLTLNTETYVNCASESFKVSKFNYYISNIKLTKTDGTVFAEPESYHLIQQDLPASNHFHVQKVPHGEYKSVSFMIGVDSARNTSGAQTGALDPANTMFWTWNTGYIMAKLEGTTASGDMFMQHIGGFKGANTGIRMVSFDFPTTLKINEKAEGEAAISADILKWFGAKTCVTLKDNADIMMPSAVSSQIADNYASMFTMTSAKIETE